jgi:hypothetical protein
MKGKKKKKNNQSQIYSQANQRTRNSILPKSSNKSGTYVNVASPSP